LANPVLINNKSNDINNEKINEVYTYSTEYSTEEILLGTEYLIEEDSDNEETISLNRDLEDVNVCLTPECIAVSENLLKSIDLEVDPCEDFINFNVVIG